MQFSRCSCFSTPCDLGKSSQIMTTGSSHLSSWCVSNPLFKKKKKVKISNRTPLGSSFPAASQNFTSPPLHVLLLEDTFVWLQEMEWSSCSSLKGDMELSLNFPPDAKSVFQIKTSSVLHNGLWKTSGRGQRDAAETAAVRSLGQLDRTHFYSLFLFFLCLQKQ